MHWTRYPERGRAHAANPVMAQFWGAPAMALMTVGTGTLLLGGGLIGLGAAVMAPTLWIVLGPLGQSVTAAGNLGTQAAHVLPAPYAAGAAVSALLYGVPTWGFAMMWLALAAAITVRTARRGLPFALTWWSFTFPVGTCVTGTIALAARSQADVLRVASVVLFALLLAAWLIVAARTVAGAASGRLFKPI